MHKVFTAIPIALLVTAAASMLVAQEREPGMEKMHKGMQMLSKMDADGNGEISREEFVQAHEKMFDSMDENGDGTLDQDEQSEMMRRMERHKSEHMEHDEMEGMPHHRMPEDDATEQD